VQLLLERFVFPHVESAKNLSQLAQGVVHKNGSNFFQLASQADLLSQPHQCDLLILQDERIEGNGFDIAQPVDKFYDPFFIASIQKTLHY
jgi:hypothetical protein